MLSHGYNTMTLSSTSLRRALKHTFVVFFLMSWLVLMMERNGRFFNILNAAREGRVLPVDGVVLSMRPERFNHTKHVLARLGLRVVQKVPPSFESKEVNQSLASFVGSQQRHMSPTNLKVWSNQMAFLDAMKEFVLEASSATPKRWRFFFEDDVALNPGITPEHAKVLIAQGLDIADEDGFVYLGICGPNCEDMSRGLDKRVEAARCYGTCAHAFGFQARAAAQFLHRLESSPKRDIYMDQNMLEYGRHVKRVWLLGSNLKSPGDGSHFGLLYQDRIRFPTTIG